MNKITLMASALLLAGTANAQLFSDDFESYGLGEYIGPNSVEWRVWSNTGEGTAEDVVTTNVNSNSGSQSIFFSSTAANGGPQDVVLDFGQLRNTDIFKFSSNFFVNQGKNAYFNFQGANTIGSVYSLNVRMDGGVISIDDVQPFV